MFSLLLAAGHGKRAGGPKAWKHSLLEKQLAFLTPRFQVRVSIQADWLARCRALNAAVDWVVVDPDAQPIDSLRALAVKAWGYVHHVDMPVWESGLFDALQPCAHDAVVPSYLGKKGHPVLLSPTTMDKLAGATRLDHLLRTVNVRVVEVPYACALENLNTLE